MSFKIPFALAAVALFTTGCSSFGSPPDEERLKRYSSSPHFNQKDQAFENRRPRVLDETRAKSSMFSLLWRYLFTHIDDQKPVGKLPEMKPDFAAFVQPSETLKVMWFGHSSVLFNLEGKIVLVDPLLSNSLGPFGFTVKRFQDAVVLAKDLPKIDYLVLTHDHYDHLDLDTLKEFIKRDTKIVTSLGVGSHLESWGLPAERIQELDWWQSVDLGTLKLTFTPSQHFSGRSFSNRNKTLWSSFVLAGKTQSLYFSGDSGYDTHFKEIGEKLGPFDIAFVESGQYNEKWPAAHMFPNESIQAFHDLKAKRYFPIHWAMLALSEHPWFEPVEKIEAASVEQKFSLVVPTIGETVLVNDDYVTKPWWKSVPREAK